MQVMVADLLQHTLETMASAPSPSGGLHVFLHRTQVRDSALWQLCAGHWGPWWDVLCCGRPPGPPRDSMSHTILSNMFIFWFSQLVQLCAHSREW